MGQFGFAALGFLAALLHRVDQYRILEIKIHDLLEFAVDALQLSLGRVDRRTVFHAELVHPCGFDAIATPEAASHRFRA